MKINTLAHLLCRNTDFHKIGEGSTLAAYVAWTRRNMRVRTSAQNPKYPEGVRGLKVCKRRFDVCKSCQSANYFNFGQCKKSKI